MQKSVLLTDETPTQIRTPCPNSLELRALTSFPKQSQISGPDTASQESQMRGSETVPQQSQLRGSDTVLQESQKLYGLIPVRYLRYLHGIVKLCNAKPDLFGLLPTLRTSAFMAGDVDFVTLTSQISHWHPAHLCEQFTELVICKLYLAYLTCGRCSRHFVVRQLQHTAVVISPPPL